MFKKFLLSLLFLTLPGFLNAQGYPKLTNWCWYGEVRTIDIKPFAHSDLFAIAREVDKTEQGRNNLRAIKDQNPNIKLLAYIGTYFINVTLPNDQLIQVCNECDAGLRDYQGNVLYEDIWTFDRILNMTSLNAAKCNNSNSIYFGKYVNYYMADWAVNNHYQYGIWDGFFLDGFSDNLSWLHSCRKDSDRDGLPEKDFSDSDCLPMQYDNYIFSDFWRSGMRDLARNYRQLAPNSILLGNGLNRETVNTINGIARENIDRNNTLGELASLWKYTHDTTIQPNVGTLNGVNINQNTKDYQAMRYTLGMALLLDVYYTFDFGSRSHSEFILYDEYFVRPNGRVAAAKTILTEALDKIKTTIKVNTTVAFENDGLILIDGELIYYSGKTSTQFLNCYRAYPRGNTMILSDHVIGSIVIQYDRRFKGYLGKSLGSAYDCNNPSLKLDDVFEGCGWFCNDEQKAQINSIVWRRDFEKGCVILNPTNSQKTINIIPDSYKRINGIQDRTHNNGSRVNSLTINSKDSFILIKTVTNN